MVAIPRKGRPGVARRAVERGRRFRRLVKWRTGAEGRISHLKHGYGWNRSLLDGIDGARTWCGFGILAHNTVKIAALIDERHRPPARPIKTTPTTSPPATGPPRAGPPPDTVAA